MSKVDELRVKYSKMSEVVFNYFIENDFTNTMKYAEYMLKIWATKNSIYSSTVPTKLKIVDYVKRFDGVLPYIDVTKRDIYHTRYNTFGVFVDVVEKAEEVRAEKLFKREDHIIVLKETDNYLLLSPKTYQGSVKYGANTQWCTTSRGSESSFNTYKRGYLVYLIDKKNVKGSSYNKIAFHASYDVSLNEAYTIYNSNDKSITTKDLINAGWKEEDITEINLYYRHFIKEYKKIRSAKEQVDVVIDFMKNLNLDKFKLNLEILNVHDDVYTNDLTNIITKFNEDVSKLELIKV